MRSVLQDSIQFCGAALHSRHVRLCRALTPRLLLSCRVCSSNDRLPAPVARCLVVSTSKQLLRKCHHPLSSANHSALSIYMLLQIPRPDVDPEAYQKALARTRQAQCVQRAIGYMRANEPSRCAA